jgi:hypothetical protein
MLGYIKYYPSYHPGKRSEIEMANAAATSKREQKLLPELHVRLVQIERCKV